MNKSAFKPQAVYRPLAPRSICELNKPNMVKRTLIYVLNTLKPVLRVVKAVRLYATTRYSWHLSWVQAAR